MYVSLRKQTQPKQNKPRRPPAPLGSGLNKPDRPCRPDLQLGWFLLYSSVPYQCRFPIPHHVVFSVFLFGNRILSSSPKCVVNFWQKYPEATCLSSLPNCDGPISALFINQLVLMLPHCFLMDMDSKIHGHRGSRVTFMQ